MQQSESCDLRGLSFFWGWVDRQKEVSSSQTVRTPGDQELCLAVKAGSLLSPLLSAGLAAAYCMINLDDSVAECY